MSEGHHAVNNKDIQVSAEGGLVMFSEASVMTRTPIRRK